MPTYQADFKIGLFTRHKVGGPPMYITGITKQYNGGLLVVCVWFNNFKKREQHAFDWTELETPTTLSEGEQFKIKMEKLLGKPKTDE